LWYNYGIVKEYAINFDRTEVQKMPLRYKIDILQALKEKGYNTNTLRKDKLISEGVIQSLRENKPISWSNISKVCELLQCQPGDIIEYVED
jgi:putative transcriptional regulator